MVTNPCVPLTARALDRTSRDRLEAGLVAPHLAAPGKRPEYYGQIIWRERAELCEIAASLLVIIFDRPASGARQHTMSKSDHRCTLNQHPRKLQVEHPRGGLATLASPHPSFQGPGCHDQRQSCRKPAGNLINCPKVRITENKMIARPAGRIGEVASLYGPGRLRMSALRGDTHQQAW